MAVTKISVQQLSDKLFKLVGKNYLFVNKENITLDLKENTLTIDKLLNADLSVPTAEEVKYASIAFVRDAETNAVISIAKVISYAEATNQVVLVADRASTDVLADLEKHIADTENPHKVTAAQVGLGNVDNTSDIDKPVSTAQQEALDTKVDKEFKTGSTTEYKVLSDVNFTVEKDEKLASLENYDDTEVKAAIEQNKTDIATNKEAIEVNATNISKNAEDIAANKSAIEVNAENIETNKNNIASNLEKIEKNTTDIATNRADIDKNAGDIATNKANIETNAANIASNLEKIEKNAEDIAVLNDRAVKYDEHDNVYFRKDVVVGNNQKLLGTAPNGSTHVLAATLSWGVGTEDEFTQNEFGSMKVHANLNSIDRPTVETPEGKFNVSYKEELEGIKAELDNTIDTMQADIEKNAQDIAKNTEEIASNDTDIANLDTRVTKNEKDIITNAENIQANKEAIESNDKDIADINTTLDEHKVLIDERVTKAEAQTFVKDVAYNNETCVFTFTLYNDSKVEIDLPLEMTVKDGRYEEATKELVLVLLSGVEIRIPVVDLVDIYTGTENDQVQVTVSKGNVIEAILKADSIDEKFLTPAVRERLATIEANIKTNADNIASNGADILALQEKDATLDVEIQALKDKDASIDTEIAGLKAKDVEIETSISTLDTKVDTEVERLDTRIDTTTADLQSKIDTNKSNIALNKSAIETNKDAIAQNKIAIEVNRAAVEENKKDIAKNVTAIEELDTRLDKAETDIVTNATAISKNAEDIASNKSNIEANAANIETNKTNIASNKSEIDALDVRVTKNEKDIATNIENIATNVTNIEVNKTAIEELATKSETDLKALEERVVDNAEAIVTNTTAIETNTANIDANRVTIRENSKNIATNTANIETNTTDIAANKEAIAKNTADIEVNKTNIAKNTADITKNSTNIAQNTADIRTNAASILDNKNNIIQNAGNISDNSLAISEVARDTAANTVAIENFRKEISAKEHFKGYFATNQEIQLLQGFAGDYAYSAESGTKWSFNNSTTTWVDTGMVVPDQVIPKTTTVPLMNGEASVGEETNYAAGDHVHPHDTTKANVVDLEAHKVDINNPHKVTKDQVGLDKVENTSDAEKPVSLAQQAALDLKVDKELKTGSDTEYKVLSDVNFTEEKDLKLASLENYDDKAVRELIANNTTAIETNADSIEANKANIEANAKSIVDNKTAIESNDTDIANLQTAVAKNTTDITTNAVAIDTIKEVVRIDNEKLDTAVENIETNRLAIEANKGLIDKNTEDILRIDEVNTRQIEEIANNKTAIEANGKLIADNKAEIDVLRTNIEQNSEDIELNAKAIAQNITDIETLEASVETNRTAIEALQVKDTEIDTAVKALQDKDIAIDTEIATLKEKDTAIETSVTELSGKVDTNTTSIETINTTLEGKVDIAKVPNVLTNSNLAISAGPMLELEYTNTETGDKSKKSYELDFKGLFNQSVSNSKAYMELKPEKVGFAAGESGLTSTTMQEAIKEVKGLVDGNVTKAEAQTFIKDVAFDNANFTLTFTDYSGATETFDFPLESTVKDGHYDADTKELVLVLVNDTEIRIPAEHLIDVYTGKDNTQIKVAVDTDKVIEAVLQANSIDETFLTEALRTRLNAIETNTADITSLKEKDLAVDTEIQGLKDKDTALETKLNTLETNVATNTANITTNTTDIATNKESIATVEAAVAGNTTAIEANATAIETINTTLETKQDKEDIALETTDKTVVGAINEIKTRLDTLSYIEELDLTDMIDGATQTFTIPEGVEIKETSYINLFYNGYRMYRKTDYTKTVVDGKVTEIKTILDNAPIVGDTLVLEYFV